MVFIYNRDMQRRIFLALTVSEALQAEIIAWATKYDRLPVRWLAGRNLHVTLLPPWPADDLEPVLSALRRPLKSRPFEYEFKYVSFGPNSRSPRLIWAEGKASPEMAELKEELEKAVGAEQQRRQFSPHLTLARFRPEDFARFPVKNISDYVAWREKAESFSLLESHLSPSGAEYEVLETFKLNQ